MMGESSSLNPDGGEAIEMRGMRIHGAHVGVSRRVNGNRDDDDSDDVGASRRVNGNHHDDNDDNDDGNDEYSHLNLDDDDDDDDVDNDDNDNDNEEYSPLNLIDSALSCDERREGNGQKERSERKGKGKGFRIAPTVFRQRWVQLFYLSSLALLSDWVCFSTASIPDVFEGAYPGHESSGLIDIFLFTNVLSCLFVTDAVAKFGLQRCIKASAMLMALGCWLRSGLGIVPALLDLVGMGRNVAFLNITLLGHPLFGLPPFPCIMAGTIMVGATQPFFQCTPPLISAIWFASNERATSTAIALNFNQVGIALAFLSANKIATDEDGLGTYFALIAALTTAAAIGTNYQFQNAPILPPSQSEFDKWKKGKIHRQPPFRVSATNFFKNPGFNRPLAAFICSITITNIVGAFIDQVMERGGITDRDAVAWAGVGFELAIVAGGVVLGQYVDRTKQYKKVTLACIAASLILLLPLGLTDHKLGQEPTLLVVSLLLLGFFLGPVQPINAELAVDVTYPGDETAVESVQQFGGNLISALLVPLASRAAKLDYQLFANVTILESDIRGDVILMILLSLATYCFYSGFDAPLRRSAADGE